MVKNLRKGQLLYFFQPSEGRLWVLNFQCGHLGGLKAGKRKKKKESKKRSKKRKAKEQKRKKEEQLKLYNPHKKETRSMKFTLTLLAMLVFGSSAAKSALRTNSRVASAKIKADVKWSLVIPHAACHNTETGVHCDCDHGYAEEPESLLPAEKCQDIDECATNTHNCDGNADCDNTDGSFQ
jgi:hypothetical protein